MRDTLVEADSEKNDKFRFQGYRSAAHAGNDHFARLLQAQALQGLCRLVEPSAK